MSPDALNTGRRRQVMREEMMVRDRIRELLREAPRTIPAVAAALERPTDHVVLWMMAMRRYGLIVEQGRPDEQGYFVYTLKDGAKKS